MDMSDIDTSENNFLGLLK